MLPDWQTSIALLLVAASAILLARRIVRHFRQPAGKGGCTDCPSGTPARATIKPFVGIEQLTDQPSPRKPRR